MRRRAFLGSLALLALATTAACTKKTADEERCKFCGMKAPKTSTWRSELVTADGKTLIFDTPKCAIISWKSGKTPATKLLVHEYYDASGPLRDASELRLVIGSDVVGPMGADLVAVEPARVTKFIQDHAASRAVRLEEVTADTAQSLE